MGVQLAADGTNFLETDTVSFTDSELEYHVRDALKAYIEGDVDSFQQLIGVLSHEDRLLPEQAALVVTCLKALSGAVSCIDPLLHRTLLDTIGSRNMWNYDTDAMDALVELLISLVGSSGQYVDFALETLVKNFMPPTSFLPLLKKTRGQKIKDDVVDRVHSALKHIYALVPLSPLRLEKIIKNTLPKIYQEEPLTVVYVENMLRLESSALGELVGSTMIVVIVDRLVDLDVEISWDDILQENFNKGIFEMELEEFDDLDDEPELDGIEPSGKLWSRRFLKGGWPEKLDSLMVLIFEHLKSSNERGRLHQVFETLLVSFQKTVMTAYKSKFAQFVMFYACSLDPDDCGTRFATTLINIFENSVHPEWRMSSVAYLASYLSRAKFVPASFVANMIERLAAWCSDYCEKQDGVMNPNAHKVFYGACQAIMYVLCFRMKQILAVPRLRSVLVRVNHILNHPLNPLKVCLPSIVEEFFRVANRTPFFALPRDFVTVDGMLESDLSMAFGGRQRLDMFFPFDPCLLKRTDSYIRPNFVYWSMVHNHDDNEATSDEDEDDVGRRSDGGMMEGIVNNDEDSDVDVDDEFDYSLDKMSITPKNLSTRLQFGGDIRMGANMRQMPSRIRPSTSPESL